MKHFRKWPSINQVYQPTKSTFDKGSTISHQSQIHPSQVSDGSPGNKTPKRCPQVSPTSTAASSQPSGGQSPKPASLATAQTKVHHPIHHSGGSWVGNTNDWDWLWLTVADFDWLCDCDWLARGANKLKLVDGFTDWCNIRDNSLVKRQNIIHHLPYSQVLQ